MAGPKKTHQHMNSVASSMPKIDARKVEETAASTSTTTKLDATLVATNPVPTYEYRPSVITCWSVHKHRECLKNSGDVLIDDRPMNHQMQQKWEDAGGTFIHHTSTKNTIQQLKRILGLE